MNDTNAQRRHMGTGDQPARSNHMDPLTALDDFLSALWTEHGDTATNGIDITLPHTLAQSMFAEFPGGFGNERHSIRWVSPYGLIVIRDADHA